MRPREAFPLGNLCDGRGFTGDELTRPGVSFGDGLDESWIWVRQSFRLIVGEKDEPGLSATASEERLDA